MTFDDILAGCDIYVDTNVLVYAFAPHGVFGPACNHLLTRIDNREIAGYSCAQTLSELCHRLMTVEANHRWAWPFAGMAGRLKKHPTEVQKLSRPKQAIDELNLVGLNILPVTGPLVSVAVDISQQTGLLSSDALAVATMRQHGLTHIASHDTDFDHVPGLTRYAPV